jgi:hypothetical protein
MIHSKHYKKVHNFLNINILGIKEEIPISWTNYWNFTGFERIDVPVNDAKGVSNVGLFRWKSKELLQQFAL